MKHRVRGSVRVRAWDVMSRAVEEGVAYGWNRAHKHTSTPDADAVRDAIEQAVMNAISESFDFEFGESP